MTITILLQCLMFDVDVDAPAEFSSVVIALSTALKNAKIANVFFFKINLKIVGK